jgi:hypothetical protein
MKLIQVSEARKNPELNIKVRFKERMVAAINKVPATVNRSEVYVIQSTSPTFKVIPQMHKDGVLVASANWYTERAIQIASDTKYLHLISCEPPTFNAYDSTQGQRRLVADAAEKLGYKALDLNQYQSSSFDSYIQNIINSSSYPYLLRKMVPIFREAGFNKVHTSFAPSLHELIVNPTQIKYYGTVNYGGDQYNDYGNILHSQQDPGYSLKDSITWLKTIAAGPNDTGKYASLKKQLLYIIHNYPDFAGYQLTTIIESGFQVLPVKYGDDVWAAYEQLLIQEYPEAIFEYAIKLNKRFPKRFEKAILYEAGPEGDEYEIHFGLD